MMPTDSNRASLSGICGKTEWTAAEVPINRSDEQLDHVAEGDKAYHAADDQLDRPEALSFEHQHAIGDDRGDGHPGEQRHLKQQREADGAAEELGQIGRHRGNLADHPHGPDNRARKLLAAHLRKVMAGHDAELGRKRLVEHRDQIGREHHPEQGVAVFGPGLDVGGEVAGVHVGNRSDNRRPGEGKIAAQAAGFARQQQLGRGDGPFR